MKLINTIIRLNVTAALIIAAVALPHDLGNAAVDGASAFRFSGDGHLKIYNTHTKKTISIIYRDSQGVYDDEALKELDGLLACHYDKKQTEMSLKLIELVDYIQDHFAASEIQVISAFRSPEYNRRLRRRSRNVGKKSFHMYGRAMDIILPGVSSQKLRNFALSLKSGGVGYYGPGNFVHIDTGPVRRWSAL